MSEDSTVFDESVSELVDAIRAGEIPLGNLLDAYLDRIKENDRLINAYVTITEDLARELADTAQRMIESGEELGPLHGIPIALDDNGYLRNGVPQTFGSPVFADMDFVAPRTEVVTARLETAGAIILGKTNLAEFGHKAMTDNNFAGATANPFDTSKNAGGHSGGAAAAVAAGMAPAAAGSDGGGSIRVPAASCGIYGLKPSPRIDSVRQPHGCLRDENPLQCDGTPHPHRGRCGIIDGGHGWIPSGVRSERARRNRLSWGD